MFKTLLKVRLRSMLDALMSTRTKKKSNSKAITVVLALLLLYSLGAVSALIGLMFFGLAAQLDPNSLGWLYFGFAGFVSFALCLITGIFTTQSQLFMAKDNDLLLSMPIPPRYILGVRMFVVLALDYLFSLLINTIALVIFIIMHGIPPLGIVAFIFNVLTLPLLSFALSALVGWAISMITLKLKRSNIVSIVLFTAFFVVYMYFCTNAQQLITSFIANSEKIAGIAKSTFIIYHYGNAIATGNMISMLIWLLITVIPFLAVYFILTKSFIRIVTNKKAHATVKYVAGKEKVRTPISALTSKELRHLFGSTPYFMNCGISLIILLILCGMGIYKYPMIKELATSPTLGSLLPTLICAGICFVCSMNITTAPSISLEGKNLWIVKSMPIDPYLVLLAKIRMHEIFTAPVVLSASLIFNIILMPSPIEMISMILLPQAVNLLIGLCGLLINLRFPKFDYLNEMQAVKQSMSVMITMFGSWGLLILLIVPGILLSFLMPVQYYVFGVAVVLSGVCALFFKLMKKTGVRMFNEL